MSLKVHVTNGRRRPRVQTGLCTTKLRGHSSSQTPGLHQRAKLTDAHLVGGGFPSAWIDVPQGFHGVVDGEVESPEGLEGVRPLLTDLRRAGLRQ